MRLVERPLEFLHHMTGGEMLGAEMIGGESTAGGLVAAGADGALALPEVADFARAGLVDLDFSYFVMLGLFLFLYYMLQKGLLGGLLDMFEKRHGLTDGAREAAASAVKRAETRISEYEARVGETRREASVEQKRLRTEALTAQQELLTKVRGETDAQVSAGVDELNASAKASEGELTSQAEKLGQQMAARILGGAA